MLVAYIDEIGEDGAFVSLDDKRYKTSPAFGYAGFVIDESRVREFSSRFTRVKKTIFSTEIGDEEAATWERKGADIFYPDAPNGYAHQLRAFNGLVKEIVRLGGHLFYYAEEKRLGTPKQVKISSADRRARALKGTLNRLARHSHQLGRNLMILMDSVNENERKDIVHFGYGHIYARASEHPEMWRILEAPMHVDSSLSSGIQMADWIAAYLSRAISYQLIYHSRYAYITDPKLFAALHGSFTSNSKLHLYQRSIDDLQHSMVISTYRPLFQSRSGGNPLVNAIDPDTLTKVRRVAEAAQQGKRSTSR